MTVVLFVLKIIGIVVLVVLGVILLVLAAALFVPFRYQVNVELPENEKVVARVHWLLHIVGAKVSYCDGQLDAYLRIFFWHKKLLDNEEAQEDEERFEQDAKSAAEDAAEKAVKPPDEVKAANAAEDAMENAVRPPDAAEDAKDTAQEAVKPQEETDSSEHKEKSEGIFSRIRKIWGDFSNIRKKITRIIEDERNKLAFAHLKNEALHLLKSVMPKKLSINLRFSLGSPDLTGEVLGICALFPIFYQSGNCLSPDFEADKAYAEGYVDAKGRVYLYQFLFAALRIVFDKNCKRMYRMIRKYF